MANQFKMNSEGKNRIPIREIAEVVRSKNAGPYRITFDIFFKDHETFKKAMSSGEITPLKVAQLYNILENQVILFVPVEGVFALKVTVLRQFACGSFEDSDIYGAQQHVPLLSISFPKQVMKA